jgi:hypothetical protein
MISLFDISNSIKSIFGNKLHALICAIFSEPFFKLGGVAIFAKPNIYIYICEKPEFHTSEIEILWLEVIINNLKAMVGVIYRPPHSDVSYWRKFENNIQPMFITLLFTRFDINVYTDWAVVTARVRGNFNIKYKIWSVYNK